MKDVIETTMMMNDDEKIIMEHCVGIVIINVGVSYVEKHKVTI